MRNDHNQQRESVLILTAQLAALLLVFAMPVIVLLLLFPQHRPVITLVSVYALFGISALFAGIGWNEPTYGRQARAYTKLTIALTVVSMSVSRWTAVAEHDAHWIAQTLIRAAILVLPFFVGRFIKNQINRAGMPVEK